MAINMKALIAHVDELTKHGRYTEAMEAMAQVLQTAEPNSDEAAEIRDALRLLQQMADMAQFTEELGIGPGGTPSVEYGPGWSPEDGEAT